MRFFVTLCVLLLVIGGAAGAGLKYFARYVDQPGPLMEQKIVFIAPGTGTRAMAEQLQREHVIEESYAFLAGVKLWGYAGKLQAGEYDMIPGISLRNVVGKIAQGDVYARNVTIPEGLTSVDIMKIINAADAMSGTIAAPPAEGSVMPETYAYIRNDDRNKLLSEAQRSMSDTVQDLWEKRTGGLPFTTSDEALVLASIVEKETRIPAERAKVAGVYINRLRKGMLLQSDPTVIYAVTKGNGKLDRVLYEHLAIDSPYNTYKYPGLPPTPICSPGRAAIEAVMQPEASDYLYFVADGQGGHIFAKDMAEHEANVAKYRAVQRQIRANAAAAKEPVDGAAKQP